MNTKFSQIPWIKEYVANITKLYSESEDFKYNENTLFLKDFTLKDHSEFQTIIQNMIQELITESLTFCREHNLFKNVEKPILDRLESSIKIDFPDSLIKVLVTAISASKDQYDTVHAYLQQRKKQKDKSMSINWDFLYLSTDREQLRTKLDYIEKELNMPPGERPPLYNKVVLGRQSDRSSTAPKIERRRRSSSRSRLRTRRSRSKTVRKKLIFSGKGGICTDKQ